MRVKVLTGALDPPPEAVAVPWGYVAVVAALCLAATATAGLVTLRALGRPSVEALRDL